MRVAEAVRALFFAMGVVAGALIGYTIGTVQVDKEERDE